MIEGSLRNVPLTDVFQVVVSGQKSGLLTVVQGASRARVYLERGRIQYAHLTPGAHLGEVLVRLDLLTAHEVQEILLAQPSENAGTALGLTAVQWGLLEQGELREALARQVLDVLTEITTWRSGSFVFSERSPEASQVPTEHTLDATALLMQVAARLHAEPAEPVRPGATFRRCGDPTKVALPTGGWEVLALVDGKRSAAGVAAELDLAERQVYRLLHDLERLGVIEESPFSVEDPPVLVLSGSALLPLLRLALLRGGLRPLLALDPEGAMECLREGYPRAVVVDDEGGEGWRFVRALRRQPGRGHLPVVVLTDDAPPGLFGRLRRPRAHTLRKPFHEIELQQLLARLLGRPLA